MDFIRNYQTRAFQNYLPKIRQFLNGGGDPNQSDSFKDTLLHIVSKFPGNYEVVEELVKAGADVNLRNFLGQTPLHIAVIHRNRRMVDALIRFGALVNTQDCCGNSVLHSAINTCTSIDKLWNCTNPVCLHRNIDMNIVTTLLRDTSVNVNMRNSKGDTPLLWAVKYKRLDAVRALLNKDASVDICNNDFETPLHAALYYPNPNLEIASELLICNACVACFDKNRQTSLDIVFKREGDAESLTFAKKFLIFITFWDKYDQLINLTLGPNHQLSRLYRACKEEVEAMQKQIITGKINLYDYIFYNTTERFILQPNTEIYNKMLEVLASKKYIVYLKFLESFIYPEPNYRGHGISS